jgi:hypothetical protein
MRGDTKPMLLLAVMPMRSEHLNLHSTIQHTVTKNAPKKLSILVDTCFGWALLSNLEKRAAATP